MLGGFAIGSLEEFLSHTRLEEQPGVVPDILRLLADHEAYDPLLTGRRPKVLPRSMKTKALLTCW